MRVRKNARVRRDMCLRFSRLIDTIYANDAQVARIMGYANSSPLYRIRQQHAFPDVERLERLLKVAPAPGITINLNWIVAGKGEPLLKMSRGGVTGMTLGGYVDLYRHARH
jgi:hypothetical protein